MPIWLNWQSSWFVISRLSVRVRLSALLLLAIWMGEFPSGQRGQTVNLLALPSVVRIHLPPLTKHIRTDILRLMILLSRGRAVWKLVGLITRRSQVQILSPQLCLDSSVGRAEDWKSSCHWFDSGSRHLFFYGILAQVVEHLTFNQVVPGSSPGCLMNKDLGI